MDSKLNVMEQIRSLDCALELRPASHTLYLERGKLHHQVGQFDRAFNDFIRVSELDPENREAEEYLMLLREIFAFHNTDFYNV